MKKLVFSLGFAALALGATAQVKIKDGSVSSSTTPNSNAILELESNTKGLLYPRVALQATNLPAPMPVHIKGMMVYDTVSAGLAPYAVTPGIYYNDGSQWVRVPGRTDWLIFGNANSAVNGTPAGNTDSQYVLGRVAIGANSTAAVASATSGSSVAQQTAMLSVAGGDANVNGVTVGMGGGQVTSNTAIGNAALFNNTGGAAQYNTAVGGQTLYSNTGGNSNTAVGYLALTNNTANNNTAIGFGALRLNQTGTNNVASGVNALRANTASNNVATGFSALYSNTSGASNTATGAYALYTNTTQSNNTATGYYALYANTSGQFNTADGVATLRYNTTGSYNDAHGANALFNNVSGSYNVGIGYAVLNTNNAGSYNTAIGYNALYKSIGNNNVGIGYNALYNLTSGDSSVAIGTGAGSSISTTAKNNTTVGAGSLLSATGSNNTAIGWQAGNSGGIGNNNIAIGAGQNPYVNGTVNNAMNIGGAIFGVNMTGNGASASSPAGSIGIDVVQPNSTLQVGGSFSLPVRQMQSNVTNDSLGANDFTLICSYNVSVNPSVTLPSPITCIGRMYRIVNNNSINTITLSQPVYLAQLNSTGYVGYTTIPPMTTAPTSITSSPNSILI